MSALWMNVPVKTSGVYSLTRGGKVVYVGASKDIRGRVRDHAKGDRVFDSVEFLPCSDRAAMAQWERRLIAVMNPEYNVRGRAHGMAYAGIARITKNSISRGIRISIRVDTWLQRAASKAKKSVNEFVAEILNAKYAERHAK